MKILARVALLLLLLTSIALADSVSTKQRTVTKLAEGVYVIRHADAPDTFPQGNTTVVIGDREVLVVDSCYMPSSAREDIAQIRQWTDKPVRWLVNTHWHYDHTMGNGVYAEAFPGIHIVAQSETAKQVAGYNPGWFERFPARADLFRQILESGKKPDGSGPLSESEKKEYQTAAAGVATVQVEFKQLHDRAPDLAFDGGLSLDLGNRPVQIKFLGRGNTAGDAVVYLPKEKIVATGDLLVHPVPYLFGGYPYEMIETLQRLGRMDAAVLVPGHGDIQRDRVFLNRVVDLLKVVTEEVSRQVHIAGNGVANLDKVKKAVLEKADLAPFRDAMAASQEDREFFDGTVNSLVTTTFYQTSGR